MGYIVLLKGTIAFTGSFELDGDRSKMKDLMSTFSTGGGAINHQRIFSAAR